MGILSLYMNVARVSMQHTMQGICGCAQHRLGLRAAARVAGLGTRLPCTTFGRQGVERHACDRVTTVVQSSLGPHCGATVLMELRLGRAERRGKQAGIMLRACMGYTCQACGTPKGCEPSGSRHHLSQVMQAACLSAMAQGSSVAHCGAS